MYTGMTTEYIRPDRISKQVNIKLEKDSREDMLVIDLLVHMATHQQQYALIRNDQEEIAMITLHKTSLFPVFMESCATVYLLKHLEPVINTGVCGMIYTKGQQDTSYLLTIKKRDQLLRFPKDGWNFRSSD